MILGTKPHLLILNKKDLADLKDSQKVSDHLRQGFGITDVMYTNCKDDKDSNVSNIVPKAVELIRSAPRYNREASDEFNILIIGVPNVGKSSLINRIRNKSMKKSKMQWSICYSFFLLHFSFRKRQPCWCCSWNHQKHDEQDQSAGRSSNFPVRHSRYFVTCH